MQYVPNFPSRAPGPRRHLSCEIRGLTWFQYVTDFEGTDCCGTGAQQVEDHVHFSLSPECSIT
jgi:hypothetical protein